MVVHSKKKYENVLTQINEYLPVAVQDKNKLFRTAKTFVAVCKDYKKDHGKLPSMKKSSWIKLRSIAGLSFKKPYKYSVSDETVYFEDTLLK